MDNSGITEALSTFGSDFGESLREEWKNRLLSDDVEYKRSILLSLRRRYPNFHDVERAGFTAGMLQNAVNVLRENGYHVDMVKGEILKA